MSSFLHIYNSHITLIPPQQRLLLNSTMYLPIPPHEPPKPIRTPLPLQISHNIAYRMRILVD